MGRIRSKFGSIILLDLNDEYIKINTVDEDDEYEDDEYEEYEEEYDGESYDEISPGDAIDTQGDEEFMSSPTVDLSVVNEEVKKKEMIEDFNFEEI